MEELLKDLYKRSNVNWEAIRYKDSQPYCCYHNKKLVGFCQVFNDHAVCNLVVDTAFREQGIASKLIKLSGAKYLGCTRQNIEFYVNRGFKVYCVEYDEGFGTSMYYMKK